MLSDPKVSGWAFNKHKEGSLLVSSLLLVMALTAVVRWPGVLTGVLLVVVFLIWCILVYFFRDPSRLLDRAGNHYYSPADGVISDIGLVQEVDYIKGEFLRIGIFLSVFDVHVQRSPMKGKVEFVTHQAGKNHPAYDPAASVENEQIVMGLETAAGKIIVKQISGILARKCYNYARPGEELLSGQRYGLIKFGSRVELYLPPETRILCSIGEKVQGGITALAEIVNE